MKKQNKKKQLIKTLKTSLLLGFATFLLLVVTFMLSSWVFNLLVLLGVVHDSNSKIVWLIDYATVSTFIGAILSVVVIHRPIKRLQSIIDAMEKVSNGDFSVRVTSKSRLKIMKKAINMFNRMVLHLSATEILSHDFINNFSHEFKSPITSISGFAKLLKNNELSEEERNEYLDIIISESERLSNLSTNILELSKLEKQTIITNRELYNVSEQIRICIGTLYPKWSAKDINIELIARETEIYANKAMFMQVWANLLDNAIKFSPRSEKIIVEITADEGMENKGDEAYINVSISNKGKTVKDKDSQRVFDKFFQGDTSHATSGAGLGLAMVKRIIELHEGKISLRPTSSDLTVFDICIPNN